MAFMQNREPLTNNKLRPGTHILVNFPGNTIDMLTHKAIMHTGCKNYVSRKGHSLVLVYNEAGLKTHYNKERIEQNLNPILEPLRTRNGITPGLIITHPPQYTRSTINQITTTSFDKIITNRFPTTETHMAVDKQMPVLGNDTAEQKYKNNGLDLNIYTDGSYMNGTAGAGIHIPENAEFGREPTTKSYTFEGDQTINRAELIAIHQAVIVAIEHISEPTTVNIFTDSLTSIYQLLRWKTQPNTQKYHNHRHILADILQLMHENPRITFNLRKVRAHTGITGNEMADYAAKRAILNQTEPGDDDDDDTETPPPCKIDEYIHLTDTDEYEHELASLYRTENGLPYYPLNELRLEQYLEHMHVENVLKNNSVRKFISQKCRCMQNNLNTCKVTLQNETIYLLAMPNILGNGKLWSTNTRFERSNYCKIIYNRFTTPNSAWLPKDAKGTTENLCQLSSCKRGTCNQIISPAHIMSGCINEQMKAQYTYRHNQAVHAATRAIRTSEWGGALIRTDAGKELPQIANRWTVHPTLLQGQWVKHPIIDLTMTLGVTHENDINDTDKYDIRKQETTYTSGKIEDAILKKENKYKPLDIALANNGHKTQTVIMALDTMVPFEHKTGGNKYLEPFFPEKIKIPRRVIEIFEAKIWHITVSSLASITKTYRSLTPDTATRNFYSKPRSRKPKG